jgi:hypothetical protein
MFLYTLFHSNNHQKIFKNPIEILNSGAFPQFEEKGPIQTKTPKIFIKILKAYL